MKFADLNPQQRSMLTQLATGSTLNTKSLGYGAVPRLQPLGAYLVLMGMRDRGLVFSIQEPDAAEHASWHVSDYGKEVFEGRPSINPAAYQPPVKPSTLMSKQYIVYNSANDQVVGISVSEEAMLKLASELATKNNRAYYVAALVAVVRPITQPTFTIERV